jgi:phosphoribosylformylglycinamidine synthase
VVGILEDVEEAMTFHFRRANLEILLLTGSQPVDRTAIETELGSSEYAKHVLSGVWGLPPKLDLKQEAALQKCLRELIANGEIESAHDCSEGGLAVALAEAAFVTGVGAEVDLTSKGLFSEALLFGEDASRVVISCSANKIEIIQKIALKWGIRAARIGRTVPEHLKIVIDGKPAVLAPVSELRQVWDNVLTQELQIG